MRVPRLALLTLMVAITGGVIACMLLVQSTSNTKAQTPAQSQAQMDALKQKQTQTQTENSKTCYPPEYTPSGDLVLPRNYHEWIFVGEPFTPNALNNGMANFPEFHNVYMEPCSYEKYQQTNVFPEGTIFFKELQLTLPPAGFPDGSQIEPSGRGYFPGKYNGADSTVKDTKRYAASGGWGYYNFNHFEPKAPTAKVKPQNECAYCHQASAKKDEVWTQFYPQLDK